MDPKRSRDLYWSSEATEDEARSAMAAAMLGMICCEECRVLPFEVVLPLFVVATIAPLSTWTNSQPVPGPPPAPTSWTWATLSRASEL